MDDVTILALRAKAGDRRALADFVESTRTDVVRFCGFVGRPGDPDDLAQETYERALKALDRFRGDGSARAWLLSIARRVCVDDTRRSIRRRRLNERAQAADHGGVHVEGSWFEVDQMLDVLDPERREAFVLTQFVGLSYEEAAETLGCPVGTIRSRVARARGQLIDMETRSLRFA